MLSSIRQAGAVASRAPGPAAFPATVGGSSVASSSRTRITFHVDIGPRRALYIASLKGKERAYEDHVTGSLFTAAARPARRDVRVLARSGPRLVSLGPSQSPSHSVRRQHRLFHSTSRRDAIPLIPAGLAIFKTTSVLTLITTISRILISFFPLGTIAAFKSVRGVRWLSDEARMPNVSAEAEEFWRMWCAGERAVKPTLADCRAVIASNLDADGTIPLPGGRKAWLYLNPWQHQERFKRYIDPKNVREELENDKRSMVERRTLRVMSNMRFLFPPLPAASISYYDRLDPSVQAEVNQLRRYWISLGAFKDQLFWSRLVVVGLLFLPCLLLAGVYVCALERVPFTGRWRIILLTAEEEDKISTSLAGTNWYKSVINLLTTPEAPAPPILPLTDWRWEWVQTTLRTLEDGVVAAVAASEAGIDDTSAGFDGYRPPPSKYPLKPRPRVSSRLHSALPGGDPQSGQEHLELGPPFSLMLLQKDERNAFSYGFGGKGAGGVVVFTGLLDDILANDQAEEAVVEQQKPSGVFGGLFPSPSPSRKAKRRTEPTEEQTLHLASVLAHEMGHLLLSHHLETLSQQQVLWPSLLGLSMDLIRAFIWPFTIFLGPAVNDALANMGRTTTNELVDRYGEIGFQWKHEYEADSVGLRILARAGYDPQRALTHFARSVSDLHEIQPLDRDKSESWTGSLFKLWTRATHPSAESRLAAVEKELASWTQGGK